ncbi:hypothetical protein [Pseudorhodoplanes sp.]|uniref:hypothetical protein n=1 Tax=Pseudorhodoplanes sp. TaxID=1934341 RepID=UPI003D096939
MTDTTTVVAMPSDRSTNFDWGAVIGGALIATALSFVLFAFGSAAGIASVSPYSWNNPSGMTLTIVGAAYVSIVMIGSFLVGGYFAGRYRRPSGAASVEERQSRDGAHGLLMWALALLVGIAVAYWSTAAVVSGASGAAAGAAAVAARSDGVTTALDRMMRINTDPASTAAPQNSRAEIARVLSASALTRGEITNEDRDYVARLVAAEARIAPEEARKRVDGAIEQAKAAADTARKAAAGIAFLIGALSIVAAGAAYWAAMAGGRERDSNVWR